MGVATASKSKVSLSFSMLMTGCREKKRKRVSSSSLNQAVIVSILTKLPFKSLVRFRLACKSWDSVISDRCFIINSHLQQQQKMHHILMLNHVPETFRLRFSRIELGPPATINFLFEKEIPSFSLIDRAHHCDGLLVCQTKELIHVCNPSTRELLSVPVSINRDKHVDNRDSIGFGFDRSVNKYKIVRSFYRSLKIKSKTYSLGMEVFTLGLGGASNTWRLTAEDPPYPVCHNHIASAQGAVYWKIWNGLHTSSPKAILRFDLSEEKFRLIDPPPPFQSDIVSFQRWATLMDIQDNLFCVHVASHRPQTYECLLWMLNKEEEWTLSYRFELPPGVHRPTGRIAIHQGNLFITISKWMYVLNPETSSLVKIISGFGIILTCVENLTPIGGNKEEMKTGCRGKKRKRVSSPNQDMIVSILTKLPSKSLLRFRSACKSWDSLISDRYFINSHLQQQQKMPRILMLECVPQKCDKSWIRFSLVELGPPATINFLFEKEIRSSVIGRAHHCDGLLVFQNQGSRSNQPIYVCNPSTRELLSLPTSINPYEFIYRGKDVHYRDSVGLGFDRSINKYKIVRYFYYRARKMPKSYVLDMEVFTLGGASNTWKPKYPPYPVCYKRPISAHGAVYWKVWNSVHTLPPRAILRFDLSNEEFRLIDPPPPFESDPLRFERQATLMDIQDNLFCVHAGRPQRHEFYLWMLNKEEKWTLSYRFKLPPRIHHFDNIAIHQGKLFITISTDMYVLNPETSCLLKIMSGIGQIFTCMESLTPIGGN